jgi:hypothetical protein
VRGLRRQRARHWCVLYRQQDLKMLLGIKPLTVTKRQAKELLSPKLVDRLIYAAKNFPEMGWLEILPKEESKEVRETYIVYESLERAFQRIRAGEYPPDFPSDVKD